MTRLGAAIRQNGGRWPGQLAAVLVLATVVDAAMAGPESESPSKQWALIIAVKDDGLLYTLNDARWLKCALTECGVPASQVLMMTDDSPKHEQPTLTNLQTQLGQFLSSTKIRPNDRVLVFFSGHGVALGGEIYLKASDSRSEDLEGTALPVSEVRKLSIAG